jgi:hypothetical protein
MPEVLNVEMLWQGAIGWKGMHVEGKSEQEGKILKITRAEIYIYMCVRRVRLVREQFFLLPNIGHSAILFTDK